MEEIKISVIIPAYNVEKYINRCLESIISQTLKDIEIIVVNDGSTDSTLKKIAVFMEKDKRIKLINKCNEGVSSARNEGIKKSKGNYIFYVDGDDFIKKTTLEELYNYAIRKDLDVVTSDIYIYKNEKIINTMKDIEIKNEEIISPKDYLVKFFNNEGTYAVWNKLWKKELYIKNNIFFPENLSYGEDGCTIPRLIINSKKIGKINKCFYYYCMNEESAMHRGNKIKVYDYLKGYLLVKDYFQKKSVLWYEDYDFHYKFYYVYNFVINMSYYNKTIQKNKNKDFKMLYEEMLNFIRENNFSLNNKCTSQRDKDNIIMLKFYKKSILLGEIARKILKRKRKLVNSIKKRIK